MFACCNSIEILRERGRSSFVKQCKLIKAALKLAYQSRLFKISLVVEYLKMHITFFWLKPSFVLSDSDSNKWIILCYLVGPHSPGRYLNPIRKKVIIFLKYHLYFATFSICRTLFRFSN